MPTCHWVETQDFETARHILQRLRKNTALWHDYAQFNYYGLQAGFIGEGALTLQIETTVKWGYILNVARWLQEFWPTLCLVVFNHGFGAFLVSGQSQHNFPAWNKLFFPQRAGLHLKEVLPLAKLEGELIQTEKYQIIKLAHPVPITNLVQSWSSENFEKDTDAVARIWESLLACNPTLAEARHDFHVGWWTPTHGDLKVGRLCWLKPRHFVEVSLHLTGRYNVLRSAFQTGPSTWALPSLEGREQAADLLD